jgi:predicted NAD/FAD-binding protein
VIKVEPASGDGRAVVHAEGCPAEEFDAVIFATHTDTTLAALGSAAPEVDSFLPAACINACLLQSRYHALINIGGTLASG